MTKGLSTLECAAALLECPSCRAAALVPVGVELRCPGCADVFPLDGGIACFQRSQDAYSENYD